MTKNKVIPNSHATKKQPWHRDANTIVAIISLVTTIIFSIISVINTRNIALLSNEVYIPSLEYSIGQTEPGKIFIDISNRGKASAQNVSINIEWAKILEIGNCIQSPPFQDLSTVNTQVERNITVYLPSLAIGQTFELICEFGVIGNQPLGRMEIDSSVIVPTLSVPTISPLPISTYPTISPQANRDRFVLVSNISKDLNIVITAENSKPGSETPIHQKFFGFHIPSSTYHDPSETQVAITLAILLNAFQTQSEDDFVISCNVLKNNTIIWYSLLVNEIS